MEHPKDAKRVSGSEIICADCGKTPNRCGAQACESGVVKGFRRANSRISDDLLDRFPHRDEKSLSGFFRAFLKQVIAVLAKNILASGWLNDELHRRGFRVFLDFLCAARIFPASDFS